jgi:hypothetical protein
MVLKFVIVVYLLILGLMLNFYYVFLVFGVVYSPSTGDFT